MRRLCALALLLLAACGGPEERGPEPTEPLQFERSAAATTQPRAALVREGERLARVLGCHGCHKQDLTGGDWIDEPALAILYTSNLTRALPAYRDDELAWAIRGGVRPDRTPLWEMPSHIFSHLSEPDMAALIAYLRTFEPAGPERPRIVFGPEGRRELAAGTLKPEPEVVRANLRTGPPRLDGRHDWARYMTRATCSECHGLELTGHAPQEGDERTPPPDLAVASGYTRAQFHHLLRTGEPIGGRTLTLMAEVSRGRFAHLTDREIDAIYDYLVARANRPQ